MVSGFLIGTSMVLISFVLGFTIADYRHHLRKNKELRRELNRD